MATELEPLALAALVSSRLCHDLINPIGAIGNGLELLTATIPGTPELDLIGESATSAAAKIRFFRIAFGAASPAETLDARTLSETLRGFYAQSRIALDWVPHSLPRREARVFLLLLLCAESALPLGGTIHAEVEGETIRLLAEGRRTRFEAEPWGHLRDGAPFEGCTSAQVHFLLAREHAATSDRRVAVQEAEGGFVLMLQPA